MLPPADRAERVATSGLIPSRMSWSAITEVLKAGSPTVTHRDAMVSSVGNNCSVSRIKINRSLGSSKVFNKRAAAVSRMRCTSCTITTRMSDSVGVSTDWCTMDCASSASSAAPSRTISVTSTKPPRMTKSATREVASSLPVMSRAANARAAISLPAPSGPTKRYACVGRSASKRSRATAVVWPTTASHTLFINPGAP